MIFDIMEKDVVANVELPIAGEEEAFLNLFTISMEFTLFISIFALLSVLYNVAHTIISLF